VWTLFRVTATVVGKYTAFAVQRVDPFKTEVEFLEEIQTEVLRVFLLDIHRQLY
jgi:hypothetical protein